MRAIRLDPDQTPLLVDVEPLEVFAVFGRPADSIVRHLRLGADTIVGTDVHTSGVLAVASSHHPENVAATKLLALTGRESGGFSIVGSVILVGVDDKGRIQDTPSHVFDTLGDLGFPVREEKETYR